MITSKLTSKAQTTIPARCGQRPMKRGRTVTASRAIADLTKGDRGQSRTVRDLREWVSEADRQSYAVIFEPWDIVRVPFPYTDRPVRQRRPALVVAAGDLQTAHGLLWLAMITSAAHRGWPGDVVVSDLSSAGLPAPSIVRPAKIATIDARDAGRLGTLPRDDRAAVRSYLRQQLSGLG
jgi:mRNA interferase MazF